MDVFDVEAVKHAFYIFKHFDLIDDSLISNIVSDIKSISINIPDCMNEDNPISKIFRTYLGTSAFQLAYLKHSNVKINKNNIHKIIYLSFIFGSSYIFDIYLDNIKINKNDKLLAMKYVISICKNKNVCNISYQHNIIKICCDQLKKIKTLCPDNYTIIYKMFYALCLSQLGDWKKYHRDYRNYFQTYIVKAALCRLILFGLSGAAITPQTLKHHLLIGLSNQLLDDLRDYKEDAQSSASNAFLKFKDVDNCIDPMIMYLVTIREISRGSTDESEAFKLLNYRLLQGLNHTDTSLENIYSQCVKNDSFADDIRHVMKELYPYVPYAYDISNKISLEFERLARQSARP